MRFTRFLIPLALIAIPSAFPCATSLKHKPSRAAWKKYFAQAAKLKPAPGRVVASDQLPTFPSDPWGGPNPSNWKPEAMLANSVSEALNAGWAESGAREVLVAYPVKMKPSTERPYGDGQTNASISFGAGWDQMQPPLVATLVKLENGEQSLSLRFHYTLPLGNRGVTLRYAGGSKHWDSLQRMANGEFVAQWRFRNELSWGDLFSNRVAFVQIDGWQDSFPIDFRDVVKSESEMLSAVPEPKRKFGKGDLLDPLKVSVRNMAGDEFPFLAMKSPSFGKEVNGDRYFPVPGNGIHAEYPERGGKRITAVGQGNTLVMEKSPAPFKMAYICFDARDREKERQFGAPSGGGWHEIGDPAETVFNSVERAPVVFGYANGQPANPSSGGFAYGLSDIAVIRKLRPGDALVTAAGPTTLGEFKSGQNFRADWSAGRNYHWFIFDQPHTTCAVEWVHPQVPRRDNGLGLQ